MMSKLIDLTGMKFNNLTVINRAENAKGGVARWNCLCDCGNYVIVRGSNLKSNAVKSCGCLCKTPPNKTHGESKTKLYRKWVGIKRRCYDTNCHNYSDYGGRGIRVCDEWKNDFLAFKRWVLETREDESLTIERIDVNGDYCPENCTWIDKKGQSNNRRSCLLYTYNGKTQNLTQWCEELGLNYKLIHERIRRDGWSFEKAITTPVITDGYAQRIGRSRKDGSRIQQQQFSNCAT